MDAVIDVGAHSSTAMEQGRVGEISYISILSQSFIVLRIYDFLYVDSGGLGFGSKASHDTEREDKII